ncbi:MAG: WD40/YVTN/BNR-like repeat-containing protein, partial [Candidatus Rokuibacteriota bacterium]
VVASEDDGRSWHFALFPGVADSTVWSIAVAPGDPDIAVAGAIGGEVFTSHDGGRTWSRVEERFGQIRAVHVA